jgi:hypothetical protein
MTTSLEEAFDSVLHLPQDKRMLLGRGANLASMDWSAGNIDEVDRLVTTLRLELKRSVSERCSELTLPAPCPL